MLTIYLEGEIIIFYDDIKDILKTNEINRSIFKLRKYLEKVENNKNILIIGSGGSYVTGLYAK